MGQSEYKQWIIKIRSWSLAGDRGCFRLFDKSPQVIKRQVYRRKREV